MCRSKVFVNFILPTKLPILMSFHALSALFWGWEGKKDRLDGYSWIKYFSHPGTLLFAALLNGCSCQWVHSEGKPSLQAWRLEGRRLSRRQNRGVPRSPNIAGHTASASSSPLPSVPHGTGTGTSQELTSSSGSSLSSGSELVSSPMRKGVGEHTMSIMAGGRTGM